MFPTFVTILPLTIPANYRLSSQFLSVGLKVGVRVWLMQKYLFATFGNAKEYFFRNQPIKNKNGLWRPCLLTDRN